jgi:hypothetical protein
LQYAQLCPRYHALALTLQPISIVQLWHPAYGEAPIGRLGLSGLPPHTSFTQLASSNAILVLAQIGGLGLCGFPLARIAPSHTLDLVSKTQRYTCLATDWAQSAASWWFRLCTTMPPQLWPRASAVANQRCATMAPRGIVAGVHMDGIGPDSSRHIG